MAFQTKNFVSIVAGMLNHMRGSTTKISDYQTGSVARTLVEAPAVEVEQLYQQMFIGLREAIPVATFQSFGFDRKAAAYASGTVRVSRAAPVASNQTIPSGTVFSSADGRRYLSVADVTWLASSLTVAIPVVAESSGLAWNISAGGISASSFFGAQVVSITNDLIASGRDVETDDEREARFAEYVASLSRGTVEAVRYAAKQAAVLDASGDATEYVARLGLIESPGHVTVYIYSSRGLPSAALLENGQKIVDGYRDSDGKIYPGYRAGGVRVDVLSMSEKSVPCSVRVGLFAGYSLDAATINALTDAYQNIVLSVVSGETLYAQAIINQMLQVPGVSKVVLGTNENVLCRQNQVLIPGAVTASALNE